MGATLYHPSRTAKLTAKLPCLSLGLFLMTSALLIQGNGVGAYQEIRVVNGGTIHGEVTYKGTPPSPVIYDLTKIPDPEVCGLGYTDNPPHLTPSIVTLNVSHHETCECHAHHS